MQSQPVVFSKPCNSDFVFLSSFFWVCTKWLEQFNCLLKNGSNLFICSEEWQFFFPFFYPDWNVLFQQPSTSCLACPVRTWHDGKKGETSLAADRAEIHCLKVKHGNDTKRPHIPGTSTKYKRKPRTLPSLVPYGQKLAMLDLDCERHQNRNVHNC